MGYQKGDVVGQLSQALVGAMTSRPKSGPVDGSTFGRTEALPELMDGLVVGGPLSWWQGMVRSKSRPTETKDKHLQLYGGSCPTIGDHGQLKLGVPNGEVVGGSTGEGIGKNSRFLDGSHGGGMARQEKGREKDKRIRGKTTRRTRHSRNFSKLGGSWVQAMLGATVKLL